ncbi:MAG: DUF86 domain-containing protein [Desulfotomaculum sp.]|nr:DUF86 domain-containing protein [Desulfotomaculum sp.]MCL0028237.1 DUF86 domain-containing protein [Peptococcaceae bacterium]MCL0041726.1 DUF86 domain-containing protein [Peptococcaceae bacterium]MCL0063198.1 DUF86 domain-containing protein [Peptococcaceae bacterium]MCL0077628.1 DUF86 domain-containing protein [Peptococcaceae bacterium]
MNSFEFIHKRIYEEYENNPQNLLNYTKQDSIILNIQRATEACIDLAMHIVAEKSLGIPQSSRDGFELLYKSGIIDEELNKKLKAMVGFRNIVVRDYQNIDLDIVKKIVELHLGDMKQFASFMLKKL